MGNSIQRELSSPLPPSAVENGFEIPPLFFFFLFIVHRLHGNRGGGHGSWAPARHPAPRRLQTPGLRPPRRRGPRGLSSEFPAPAPLRPRLQPHDFVGSQMARRTWAPVRQAMPVPGRWHRRLRQETRAPLQDEDTVRREAVEGIPALVKALGVRPTEAHNRGALANRRPLGGGSPPRPA